MVKELMARIILGLLSGLVVVGFLILLGIIPARAEMLDPWGQPRYQAPREAKPVRKRQVRRKPQVKAYVKREDDDAIKCKDMVVVIGDARPSVSSAKEDAESVFMRTVRYKYGESWMDVQNARDYASRCARASITEIVGQVMTRCEIKARPCRAPFESR